MLLAASPACSSLRVTPGWQICSDLHSQTPTSRSRCGISERSNALSTAGKCLRASICRGVLCRPRISSLQRASRSSEEPKSETEVAPAEGYMSEYTSVSKQALLSGQLCLCGVAFLWGSYSPVVRYMYSCSGPPTPATLTAVRTVIQAAVLVVSEFVLRQQQHGAPQKAKVRRPSSSPLLSRRQEASPSPVRRVLNTLSNALQSTNSELWIAGAELGFWNFCGSTFQALGLQYTTATRGAFLIQVSRLNL